MLFITFHCFKIAFMVWGLSALLSFHAYNVKVPYMLSFHAFNVSHMLLYGTCAFICIQISTFETSYIVGLLTVYIRIKVHMDLQADKSPVVVKGPFFPRVVNPRYRICGTMCNARNQFSKAKKAIF
jgi:hypothetical protein